MPATSLVNFKECFLFRVQKGLAWESVFGEYESERPNRLLSVKSPLDTLNKTSNP